MTQPGGSAADEQRERLQGLVNGLRNAERTGRPTTLTELLGRERREDDGQAECERDIPADDKGDVTGRTGHGGEQEPPAGFTVVNTNIATVGSQSDVRRGGLSDEQIADRVQRAHEAAAQAVNSAHEALKNVTQSNVRAASNVASGQDRVEQQNGVNFGNVVVVNSGESTDDKPERRRRRRSRDQDRAPGRTGGIGSIRADSSVTVINGGSGVTYTAGPEGDVTVTRHGGNDDDPDVGEIWIGGKRVK